MIIPALSTERLLLRGPTAEDFPAYRAFYADPRASAAYGGPMRAGLAWRKLAADIGHWPLRGFGLWSIVEKSSGETVGGCGIVWPEDWPRHELTWWILPSARRKGYALEASRAAIGWAIDALGWERVETHMNDNNRAARRLAEKLGGQVIARERFPDGIVRSVYELAISRATMSSSGAPYHAHIYYSAEQRSSAAALRDSFAAQAGSEGEPRILFVGRMMDEGVGPHPLPQYEVHFREASLAQIVAAIEASGLRALVHPLTQDDLADHTHLGRWIGEPVELDLTMLDPPGVNQGVARFGKADF
jgi:[ribosomal protein S5]-alanine N-acetyltransferase